MNRCWLCRTLLHQEQATYAIECFASLCITCYRLLLLMPVRDELRETVAAREP